MVENDELAPLRGLLDSVLGRLEALEAKVGCESPKRSRALSEKPEPEKISPALVAYDIHVETTVVPFAEACAKLGLQTIGNYIIEGWFGIRSAVLMASKCRKPPNVPTALKIHLKKTQNAVESIRKLRLDREFDWHSKSIMEMLISCSWVMLTPPHSASKFIKDCVGSSDFWNNKIRKQHRGLNDAHINFCETMKAMILDLAAYTKEYHSSGLYFNPKGIAMTAYEQSEAAAEAEAEEMAQKEEENSSCISGVMSELALKAGEADSAASGLKKVTREQQTWRKEFKREEVAPPPAQSHPKKPFSPKAKTKKAPVCEFIASSQKWLIENQQNDSFSASKPLTIDITDPKQQAYIYNCHNVTISLNGKLKTIVMDSCQKCNLVFDTVMSACEVVNCQKVQIQTNGVCPTYAVDKTDGFLVYLMDEESVKVANFITSKSSEMNVNWADSNGKFREAPIPEQYRHTIQDGVIASSVSDLYH